jgi:5-carboxymethyl-2-hydroxymuconate isomerase
MPHVIFEMSDNVIEKDLREIMTEIHQILTDTLPATLESCKTRVVRHKDFLVGNGNKSKAFIHLNIHVLAGRSKETLDLTVSKLMSALQRYFKESLHILDLSLSVGMGLLPESYYKV